ncbi:hypothetical protein [Flavisphingomonas formosensis]|uniref:hypothetical protein n=1 Tax=Flavisphingomonas formosensis TaxID=861534 RepID=UPI0018DF5279|nr:hypothetical protein [Sphingomonas formosensis]
MTDDGISGKRSSGGSDACDAASPQPRARQSTTDAGTVARSGAACALGRRHGFAGTVRHRLRLRRWQHCRPLGLARVRQRILDSDIRTASLALAYRVGPIGQNRRCSGIALFRRTIEPIGSIIRSGIGIAST